MVLPLSYVASMHMQSALIKLHYCRLFIWLCIIPLSWETVLQPSSQFIYLNLHAFHKMRLIHTFLLSNNHSLLTFCLYIIRDTPNFYYVISIMFQNYDPSSPGFLMIVLQYSSMVNYYVTQHITIGAKIFSASCAILFNVKLLYKHNI